MAATSHRYTAKSESNKKCPKRATLRPHTASDIDEQLLMVIPNPTSRCLTHRVIRKKLAISSVEHLSLPSQVAPECDAQGMDLSVTRKRCIPTRSSELEVPTKRRKSGAKRGTRGARGGKDKKKTMPTNMQESI